MTIRVRFFAALREQVGRSTLEIDAIEPANVCGLLAALRHRFDEAAFGALRAPNIRVAVNQELVDSDAVLRDGDEVAFMPPITGG